MLEIFTQTAEAKRYRVAERLVELHQVQHVAPHEQPVYEDVLVEGVLEKWDPKVSDQDNQNLAYVWSRCCTAVQRRK